MSEGNELSSNCRFEAPILCPRLGAEWIGRISWLPRAPLGPIFMTGLLLRPKHRAYYRSGRPVITIGPKIVWSNLYITKPLLTLVTFIFMTSIHVKVTLVSRDSGGTHFGSGWAIMWSNTWCNPPRQSQRSISLPFACTWSLQGTPNLHVFSCASLSFFGQVTVHPSSLYRHDTRW